MTHTISIYYFPKGLRYTTVLLILGACYLIYIDHAVWGVLIALLCVFVLTAQYITIIDVDNKYFVDAFQFYGINMGAERKKFTVLNKIVITKGKYSQNINTRSMSRQLVWTDFTGTLIYDDIGTLDLLTREDKKELVDALRVYASALHVEIEDQSIRASSTSSFPS